MSLKKIVLFILLFPTHTDAVLKKTRIIMLDPSTEPRTIGNAFESSITLQCAQALQKELEQELPYVYIIISRAPGEKIEPLQAALFSNRIEADLHISINCCKGPRNELDIYTTQYQTVEKTPQNFPLFMPYDQAYMRSLTVSKALADIWYHSFAHATHFTAHKPCGIPLITSKGVLAPYVCIELILEHERSWYTFIQPIIEALKKGIHE